MIGAMVRSYGATKYLHGVLKHLCEFSPITRVLVVNARFGGVSDCPDDTARIASKHYVEIWRPDGPINRHELCNLAMEKLSNCSHIFYNDADEFISPEDRTALLEEMLKTKADVGMLSVVDMLSPDKSMPIRTHKPQVLIKNGDKAFMERCFDYGHGLILKDRFVYNFGLMLDGDQEKWKSENLWYDNKAEYAQMRASERIDAKLPDSLMPYLCH